MTDEIKSLSSYLEDYLVYCRTIGKSKGTIKTYGFILHRFLDIAGVSTPHDLTLDAITNYQNSLNRTLSATSCQHVAVCIRNFLTYLRKFHIETSVAVEEIVVPKAKRKEVEILTADELDALLKAASPLKKEDSEMRDRAILELLVSSGLRVAELCNLRLQDIDLDRREIRVINGKGGKDRLSFMSPEASNQLKRYMEQDRKLDTPYLFYSTEGTGAKRGQLTTRSVERLVKRYALKAGIKKNVHPHTLRHQFASRMLARGADLRTTQELLGHASISTTQHYTHISNEALRKSYDLANSSFATNPKGEPIKNEFVVMSKESFYQLSGMIGQMRKAINDLAEGQREMNKKLDGGYMEMILIKGSTNKLKGTAQNVPTIDSTSQEVVS